jgi:hypothetical protein
MALAGAVMYISDKQAQQTAKATVLAPELPARPA